MYISVFKVYISVFKVALGDPAKVKRYGMPADRKKYEENLIKHFPKEEEAIKKFMDLLLVGKKG